MGDEKKIGLGMRMVLGATGGMGAAICCHPLDVIRVQMQIDGGSSGARQYKGSLDAAMQIVKRNGVVKGLYPGIDAAFLRQWTYGSCRLGIYAFLLDKVNATQAKGVAVPFWKKLLMGSTAGAIGSFVGTPSEIALVRMGADTKLPPEQQRKYKHVVDCCMRIVKEEGAAKLWNGATPTIIRATLLSASVLACYSEAKVYLHEKAPKVFPDKEGIPLMFVGTMWASLIANITSCPFDVIKSRIQNMPVPKAGEKPLYSGMPDAFIKSVKGEGIVVLWRGFTPAFVKLAPYTTISLILVDKMTKLLTGKSAM